MMLMMVQIPQLIKAAEIAYCWSSTFPKSTVNRNTTKGTVMSPPTYRCGREKKFDRWASEDLGLTMANACCSVINPHC